MDTPLAVTPWTALPNCLQHQFLAVCLMQSATLTTSSVSADAEEMIWKGCTLDIRRYHGICLAGLGKTTNCFSADGRT